MTDRRRGPTVAVGGLILLALLTTMLAAPTRQGSARTPGVIRWKTTSETIAPRPAGKLRPASAAQLARGQKLFERIAVLHAREARGAAARPQERTALNEDAAEPTSPLAGRFHGTPSAFVASFKENTLADDPARASQISEPSAVNEGKRVFMAGNFYQSFSNDGGATWTNVAIPAGPAEAPDFCCDIDTVYDQGRAVTFRSLLYFRDFDADPDPDNGVVRIFVRRGIAAADSCAYVIDPDGASNNVLPDFPHIALSTNALYLSTNEIGNAGGQTAKVRRFNLDQMADCVSVATSVFSLPSTTLGNRVFRPVEGARDTMFFAALIGSTSSTSIRVFRWLESSASVTSADFPLTETSLFGNADCRGGTNNADWWDPSTATITGFELVGAVGGNTLEFLWDVKGDSIHPQGHIHGVRLRIAPTLVRTASVVLQNPGFCMGFPQITSNERGDFGLTLSAGGKAGGNTPTVTQPAIQAWAGLDDDLDGGTPDFVIVKAGTHMPTNGRFGDYSTVHQHEPCDLFFNATNYVLTGGGGATNVDALYMTFGRGRETPCFNGWNDEDRLP